MKLATYKDGSRDGQLVVVSRDLSTAHYATGIANQLQQVLDDWNFLSPQLQDLYDTLNQRQGAPRLSVRPGAVHGAAAARLPVGRRLGLHQPRGAGAHGAQLRGAGQLLHRPADVPGRQRRLHRPAATTWSCASEDYGIDFEAEVAVITGDVPMGSTPEQALDGIRLVMLANDVSLRNLIPDELAKGFGFFQSKPATAFSPVAVTLDELGDAWDQGRAAPDAAKHLERPQGRHVRRRPGDDLPLRPADRPHLQDAQCARRLHRRLGHGQQQGRRGQGQDRLAQGLQLHRRKARDRNHPGRQARPPNS